MSRVFALMAMLTLLLVMIGPAVSSQKDFPREMVAVVSSISGNASVVAPPEKATRAVHLFDWLPTGSVVKVPAGSQLTLAFASGSRYEMGEKSGAKLSNAGPKADYGNIRPLEPVPPIPRLALLAAGSRPGVRAGGIILRAPPAAQATVDGPRLSRISYLYPRAETATLPDSTVLRFAPIAGVDRHTVVLTDQAGNTIFESETQSAQLAVPAGVLQPGARYSWKVRTVETTGPGVSGDGEFVTLSSDEINLRAAFKARMETKGDAESLALLAEIDRRLGLLREARDEFLAAVAKAPSDPALRRVLEETERELLKVR